MSGERVLQSQMRLYASGNTQMHAESCLTREKMDFKWLSHLALQFVLYLNELSHRSGINNFETKPSVRTVV